MSNRNVTVSHSIKNVNANNIPYFLANEPPPSMLKRWLLAQGKGKTCSPEMAHFPHDVYVIGTQESAMSEKEWVTKLKNTLQDELHCPLHTVRGAFVIKYLLNNVPIMVIIKGVFKGRGSGGSNPPPRNFQIFLKSEGKEAERKIKNK